MIEDFNHFSDGTSFAADVCILGAGAAGITIAREFLGTSSKVLLLESGGFGSEPDSQKLYDSEITGLRHTGIHEGRARIFGGTTTLWGGQALRFDEFDFEERSWVPYSGWPISRAELDPYYDRAERVLHLGPRIPYAELCASHGITPPSFDPDKLYMECSRWSPKPNFGMTYRQELKTAPNVTVLLHANVTAVVTNDAAMAVESVEFSTLDGKKGSAKARYYIICCGGIETARLLLASDRVEPHGVGNRNDLVGRCFQEHVHLNYGNVLTGNRAHLQDLFESFFVKGLKHAPLVTLTQRQQTEKQLLSVHANLTFEPAPDSGIVAMKKLFRAVIGRSVSNVAEMRQLIGRSLANPAELLRLAYRLRVQKRAGTPQWGPIFFGAQCEMAPNPESRVLLSETRDRLGMPRVRLDWKLGELERRTLSEFITQLAGEFARLGLGTFDLEQAAIFEDPAAWLERAHDSAHHMGTTRMHRTPQLGVVDPQCQVHGIENLYIGSSAVFPTSARSNPTLTILALCLRIADRVKGLCS
ncbi:MAG TPA: GMC family oxidoreductase [Candidatus Acidoferrales bacterium]|nr:GMC family oxidoreductase [Candidatus Acidoferrales bacterium]